MRRRIAAVAILVLVLFLLWWFIGSLGGGDDKQNVASDQKAETSQSVTEQTASESAKPKESTSESAKPSDKNSDKSSASNSASETTKADEKPKKNTCGLADLEVVASPGSPSFAPDAVPNFFVTINNPTSADCKLDLSKDKLSFEVFTLNNYQRVWGDLDCNESGASGERTIKAGENAKFSLDSWSRTTSAPNACEDRQPVGAGSYLLYAHVGDNTSKPATFNLQ